MSSPNGQSQQQGEPVDYADVLEYWRGLAMELHSKASVTAALLANRDREIAHLRSQLARPVASPAEDS